MANNVGILEQASATFFQVITKETKTRNICIAYVLLALSNLFLLLFFSLIFNSGRSFTLFWLYQLRFLLDFSRVRANPSKFSRCRCFSCDSSSPCLIGNPLIFLFIQALHLIYLNIVIYLHIWKWLHWNCGAAGDSTYIEIFRVEDYI